MSKKVGTLQNRLSYLNNSSDNKSDDLNQPVVSTPNITTNNSDNNEKPTQPKKSGLLGNRLVNKPDKDTLSIEPKTLVNCSTEINKDEKTKGQRQEAKTDNYEEFVIQQEVKETKLKKHNVNKSKAINKMGAIFFTVLCLYMVFLVYGVIVTDYIYTDNGTVEPEILSVSEIKQSHEFKKILNIYNQAQKLYEETLTIDYRLSTGLEDQNVLATEYASILDDVNTVLVQINALDISTKYDSLKTMLTTWVQTDIAVYLQDMNTGITQNNKDDANTAIQYREYMYSDFNLIIGNVVSIGKNIKGVDISKIEEWSPDSYLEKEYGVYSGVNSN